jgi:hypothetical protein
VALTLIGDLTTVPESVSLPATIEFSGTVVDRVSSGAFNRNLALKLSDSEDLQFTGGGGKIVRKAFAVGPHPTAISFLQGIAGTGRGLLGFRVDLVDLDSEQVLGSCFVRLT